MKKSRYEYPVPEHQTDVTLNQANPISGTLYEVLAATPNVRLVMVAVRVTWTVQPTPLEVHITIDGVTYTASYTDPITATDHFLIPISAGYPYPGMTLVLLTEAIRHGYPIIEGRNIRVQVETTGGTVSALQARVRYARW